MTENAKQLVRTIFAIHRTTPPYSSESIPLTDNGVKVGILVRKDEGFPLVGNINGLI